ncbi:MAG: L,D-transpeptidase [Pyrinomonadaceae bacterium MAG19_C2-C3]|nr:L,D-transpeptidase [Pyrinomonadaceae bacterium MAG19_C2-C3]
MRLTTLIALLSLAVFASACVAPEQRAGRNSETSLFNGNKDAASQNVSREPTITLAPVEQGEGGWKVATNDAVTFTVSAPGASEVKLLYRPVISDELFVELKTLRQPTDGETGTFQTEIKTPEDFAGEVWARASYPNGTKQTEPIALTTQNAIGSTPPQSQTANGSNQNQIADNSQGSDSLRADESTRSDKATGGRIVQASLRAGNGDIRITVNVPAFLLTLWQGDKEVATYHVGVGRKAFPIPIGEREANRIILNPAWIPPDSAWVRQSSSVEPFERVPADDPRNPLGKIKIPLGDAYLIHEAQSPSDIGNLVSHGCIRVRREDLFDLTRKIATARALPEAAQKIERARDSSERIVLDLDEPLPVDINYDTQVVEGATLRLYPDVYERGTNTIERLREEMAGIGVDAPKLEDATLRQMLERVSSEKKFVMRVADVRAGQALARGKTEPLTPQQAKKPDEKDEAAQK